tara:strand:+ start:1753 stop:2601 length:849 start_codon:yes stop_codon:yes gene_type:complete
MKLTIGTAQFGLRYGANKEKIKKSEIKKITSVLKINSIEHFDTAMSYGESEKVIGDIKNKKKVITKIKLPSKKPKDLKKWFNRKLLRSLQKLKAKSLYGLLIHDTSDILGKNNEFLNIILDYQKKNLIMNVGISVYEPKEIKKILQFWIPDIVQFPLNIFDQRFLKNSLLKKLKKLNIKIYARSCFLQGMLLNDHLKLGNIKSQKLFKKYKKWCSINKINQITACLHFIKKIKHVDYLIIGFDNVIHLNQIINSFNKKLFFVPNIFNCNEKKFIDPRKWSFN